MKKWRVGQYLWDYLKRLMLKRKGGLSNTFTFHISPGVKYIYGKCQHLNICITHYTLILYIYCMIEFLVETTHLQWDVLTLKQFRYSTNPSHQFAMELVTENMFFYSSILYVIKTIFIICIISKIASISKTCWILGNVVYMYYSRLPIQTGRGMH